MNKYIYIHIYIFISFYIYICDTYTCGRDLWGLSFLSIQAYISTPWLAPSLPLSP